MPSRSLKAALPQPRVLESSYQPEVSLILSKRHLPLILFSIPWSLIGASSLIFSISTTNTRINEGCTLSAGAPRPEHQPCWQATREPYWNLQLICCCQQRLPAAVAISHRAHATEGADSASIEVAAFNRPALFDDSFCLFLIPSS